MESIPQFLARLDAEARAVLTGARHRCHSVAAGTLHGVHVRATATRKDSTAKVRTGWTVEGARTAHDKVPALLAQGCAREQSALARSYAASVQNICVALPTIALQHALHSGAQWCKYWTGEGGYRVTWKHDADGNVIEGKFSRDADSRGPQIRHASVTRVGIEWAVQRMLEMVNDPSIPPHAKLGSHPAGALLGRVLCDNTDGPDGDVLLQIAVFGVVVYG